MSKQNNNHCCPEVTRENALTQTISKNNNDQFIYYLKLNVHIYVSKCLYNSDEYSRHVSQANASYPTIEKKKNK